MDKIPTCRASKPSKLNRDSVFKTLQQLHDKASSVLSATGPWGELEEHVEDPENQLLAMEDTIRELLRLLKEREEKVSFAQCGLKEKERLLGLVQESIRERFRDVLAQEEELERNKKLAVDKHRKEMELVENSRKELDSVRETTEKKLQEIDVKQKEYVDQKSLVDERFKQLKVKEEILEKLRRKRYEQLSKDFEVKEKQLAQEIKEKEMKYEECCTQLKLKEVEIEFKSKEIELKNEDLEKRLKDVELSINLNEASSKQIHLEYEKLQEKSEELNLWEKQLDKKSEVLELKAKKLGDQCRELFLNSNRLEERARKLELREQKFEEQVKELELMQKQVQERSKEVELTQRKLREERCTLVSKDKQVEECIRKLELREKKFQEQLKEHELKEKKVEERSKEVEMNQKELRDQHGELVSKSKQIEEWSKELELKVKKFEEQFKDIKLKEKLIEERSNEVELSEKKLEDQNRELVLRVSQIEELSRELELKEQKFEGRFRELELREKQFEERSNELELKNNICTKVKVEPEGNTLLVNKTQTCSRDANLQFCVTMDGKALQIYLNERWKEHDSLRSEVFVALQLSSDPAKLVLDAMQGFYPPHLKKDDMEFEEIVVRRTCVLLFDQLMRLSPEIKDNVRKEAMKLAFDWITKMRVDVVHSLEVLGFLQLVAVYGLADAFDANELLNYLEVVAQHSQAPELLRALGFRDKISGFINRLVEKEHPVEATKFIQAFQLAAEYPPVSLLKDYMKHQNMTGGNGSLAAKNEARNRRITDAKAVLKCIEDYKLESEYPPEDIEGLRRLIYDLENEIANSQKIPPTTVAPALTTKKRKKHGQRRSFPLRMPASAPTTALEMKHQEEGGNKRPRVAVSEKGFINLHPGLHRISHDPYYMNAAPKHYSLSGIPTMNWNARHCHNAFVSHGQWHPHWSH